MHMAISAFFRRARREPEHDLDGEAARLRIELRLARFRLEETGTSGPDREADAGEVAGSERAVATAPCLGTGS